MGTVVVTFGVVVVLPDEPPTPTDGAGCFCAGLVLVDGTLVVVVALAPLFTVPETGIPAALRAVELPGSTRLPAV